MSFNCFLNSSKLKFTLKPFIEFNLSIVPPVIPRPFPLILGNITPQLATIGPTIKVVLSPIPPVECLSILILSISYSIFESCYYKKPVITENYGITPQLVNYYKIGYVLDRRKIKEFINSQHNDFEFNFSEFLNKNNWNLAAKKLAKYYNNPLASES